MTATERRALEALDGNREALVETLRALVAIDSQSFGATGRERVCAARCAHLYQALGLETALYTPDETPGVRESPLYWPGHHTDQRHNATGVWRGTGEGAVMLLAHTDTMPVGDEAAWTTPPLEGLRREGRLYGRGVSDDKWGIAAAYWVVRTLRELGWRPEKDVILSAYCDEEFGGGNGALAACLRYPCDAYINLDGGSFHLGRASVGGGCYRLSFRREGTDSSWEAIWEAMSLALRPFRALGEEMRQALQRNPLFAGTDQVANAFRMERFGSVGSTHTEGEACISYYTTLTRREFHRRLEACLAESAPALRQLGVTCTLRPTTRFFDYGVTPPDRPVCAALSGAIAQVTGADPVEEGCCLSDFGVLLAAERGDCVNFGIFRDFTLPGGAHQPDEYVELEELHNAARVLLLTVLRLCGGRFEK